VTFECGRALVVQGDGKVSVHKDKRTGDWCPGGGIVHPPQATAAGPMRREPTIALRKDPSRRRTAKGEPPAARSGWVHCDRCGRTISGATEERVPPHLNTAGTRPCRGSGAPVGQSAGRAATTPRPTATGKRQQRADGTTTSGATNGADGSPSSRRPPGERLDPIERRERRNRDRAFADLEVRAPSEDLDESLFRAQARRGGLPSLGGRR